MADWYASSVAYAAVPAWAATTAYTVGQFVRPTVPATNNQWFTYRCTTAGTSGAAEPGWPTANNATVTNGTAVFANVTGQSAYGWSAAAGNLFTIGGWRCLAGDRVFLSSDHNETFAVAVVWSFNNLTAAFGLIQIISVNRAGSIPPTAADIQNGATLVSTPGNAVLDAFCNLYFQGITISSGASIIFNSSGTKAYYLKNCSLVLNNAISGSRVFGNSARINFDNTTVQFGAVGQSFGSGSSGGFDVSWLNTLSPLAGAVFPTTLFNSATNLAVLITCRGIDLSSITGTLVSSTALNGMNRLLLDSCRIAASVARMYTPAAGHQSHDEVELINCFDGTGIVNERYTPAGAVTADRSTTMTGGAQDDIGAYSLKLASSSRADKSVLPLDSFWLDVGNAPIGTAKTATVEIFSSGSLNNDDISLLLEYMGGQQVYATTFNPADLSNVALSGGNLVAAVTANPNGGVRGNASLSAGKYYWENTYTSINTNSFNVGIALATASVSGVALAGIAYVGRISGAIIVNNLSSGSSIGIIGNGNVVGVAVDFTAKLIWFRIAPSGNWNGSGTANPATGVGGVDITSISTGPLFPIMFGAISDTVTANFGAGAFTGVVPSGFTAGFGAPTLNNSTSLASFASSLPSPLATPAALPTSSAAWSSLAVTWDPATATAVTLSGGNLVATNTGTTSADQGAHVPSTMGQTSGKYYFEAAWTAVTGGANFGVGIGTTGSTYTNMGNGGTTGDVAYRGDNVWSNGSSILTSLGGAWAAGQVIGIAVDLDNRRIWFRQAPSGLWNNNAANNPATNVGGLVVPAGTMVPFVTFGGGSGVAGNAMTANFGASSFSGTVPSGFASGWLAPTPVKQKLQVSFTPQRAGRVRGLVRLGKVSATVWVNPQLAIA